MQLQLPSRQGEAHRVIAATRGPDATAPSGPTGQGLSRISWDTSPTVGTIGVSSVLRTDCLHQIHDPASRIGAVLGTNCLHQIHDPTSHIGVFNLRE